MRRRVDPESAFAPRRHRFGVAVRRLRLGVLMFWRRRWPPVEEVDARSEQRAERQRALEEFRLAAEEYRWAVAGGGRRSAGHGRTDSPSGSDPAAEPWPRAALGDEP